MTQQASAATLWNRTGLPETAEEGSLESEGVLEVTKQVQTLLGFSVDQFRQVVLLPQGQFEAFLRADTRAREEVLKVLFRTHDFERIELALKGAARQAEEALRESRKDVDRQLAEAGVADMAALSGRIGELGSVIPALEARDRDLKRSHETVLEDRSKAEGVLAKLLDRDKAKADLARLKEDEDLWRERRQELEAARRVADAVPLLEGREQAEARLLERQQDRQRLDLELAASEDRLARLSGRKQELDSQAVERDRLSEGIRELKEQLERLAVLGSTESELKQKQDVHRALEASRKQLEDQRASDRKERLDLEASMEAWRAQAVQAPELDLEATSLEGAIGKRNRLADSEQALAGALRNLQDATTARSRTLQALDEAQEARNTVEGRWIRGQAALLAKGLRTGEPCPVCGSEDHPRPASGGEEVPSDADVESSRTAVDQATERDRGAQDRIQAIEGRKTQLEAGIALLHEDLGELAGLPISELEARLAQARSKLRAIQSAQGRLEQGQEHLKRLVAQIELAEEQIEGLRSQVQEAFANVRAVEARRTDLERKLPPGRRDLQATTAELAAVEARLRSALEEVQRTDEAHRKAISEHAELQGHANRLAADLLQSEQLCKRATQAFAEALAKLGMDTEGFLKARRTPEAIQALDQACQAFQGELKVALDRAQRTEEAARGLVVPDMDALDQAVAAARQASEEAHGILVQTRDERLRLQERLARIEGLAGGLAALEVRARGLGRLNELAQGGNTQNLSFHRYVLRGLLDQVLEAATKRLEPMSQGRYALVRSKEVEDRRSAAGLDLSVLDAFSGQTRPVRTLSGGEGFMASLCLALGLSDVVQAHAGGIRLDAVFVDEGFGSLSQRELDNAIHTLKGLQEGGRLVGIISHVSELQQRIPARLEVQAGRRGSTAAFNVP